MASSDVLVDAFERIRDAVYPAVNGLSVQQLAFRPDGESNSIAWLVWHLTRIQDDHVTGLHGGTQAWTAGGWSSSSLSARPRRHRLRPRARRCGQGHPPTPPLLLGYFEEVHEKTVAYLRAVSDADLEQVIDASWDPPVTIGVRLVSVIADDLQHVGQAAYVRGVVERLGT